MSENSQEKQRLLIVDDSKVIRVTARKILREHFETIEAVDGEDAWEILTGKEPFALVVSDLTMPRLDGFGLLKRIRSTHLPHVRELPVIIITGSNDSDATKQRAREAGATDFIGKPFDAVHLLARTQAHASSHATTNVLKEEKTALEEQSAVDTTTGLYNEVSFMERGYQQLSYAIRHNTTLAMFRIEIDDFGELNQQYGKPFTETVIQAMGNTLRSVAREEDTAARIGTARFALLLPGMQKTGIRNLAERIHRGFSSRNFTAGKKSVRVTVSIGVGTPDIRRNYRFDELLAITDKHLNQAIAQGGNRVVFEAAPTPPVPETVESIQADPVILKSATAEPFLEKIAVSENHDRFLFEHDSDVEEIELYPADTAGTVTIPDNQRIPDIKNFAADTREPLPGKFAGPVPDNRATATHAAMENSPANTASEAGAKLSRPATASVADASATEVPETPSIAFLAKNPEDTSFSPETHDRQTNPATKAASASMKALDAFNKPEKPDSAPRRRGFFRKTLGLLLRIR